MKAIVSTLVFILLILISCGKDRRDIDISGIDVSIEIKRFEKDLFEIDPSQIEEHITQLERKYGSF